MKSRLGCSVVLLVGCGSIASTSDAAPGNDAAADALPDAPPSSQCAPTARFGTPVPLAGLDAARLPADAQLAYDELVLYFTQTTDLGDRDLYMASRSSPTGAFGPATPLPTLNSAANDAAASITSDLLTLVFQSDRVSGVSTHLYVATRASTLAEFGTPTLMTGVNDTSMPAIYDIQPYLTPEGTEIWFASNRSGNAEIYRATASNGFATPTVVQELGSDGSEAQPRLSADRLTVYFASNRTNPDALGSYDIYRATRSTTNDGFGTPTLVPELNSAFDERPGWLSPDGCRLYMNSVRDGALAIYVATRTP